MVLHVDESCLGNGREGENPGGSGGLVEARSGNGRIHRLDFFIHSPATTNNRMALSGAIAALQLLARKGARVRALIVSDSEYLVKGMREWAPGWMARGPHGDFKKRMLRTTTGSAEHLHAERRITAIGPCG